MDLTDHPVPHITLNKRDVFIPIQPTHQAVVIPLIGFLSVDNIWTDINYLSTTFLTRYYTSDGGIDSSDYLASEYASYKVKPNIEVTQFVHSWPQRSIIARIQGSKSPNEIVIIGGHIDSTSSGAAAPGADDDASGSCTVLEIFRVLASDPQFAPERTIEFHGYSAEEVGLRGSQDIADTYADEGKTVVAMLQLDMTGYVKENTTPSVGVVTDFTNPTLTAFVRTLVPAYTQLPSINTACGYGCSDHASWYRAGFPAAFTFESAFSNSNPYIHTPNDQRSRLSIEQVAQFAKLGLSFVVELSFIE